MARAGLAPLAVQAHEIDPAHLRADRAAELAAHPVRDQAPQPVVALRRRAAHRRGQLGELLGREQRRGTVRVRVVPVAHPVGAFGVVAFGDLADPIARIARATRRSPSRSAPCQQPEDLPPTALVRLFGRPVAALQLVHRQVRFQAYASGHALIRTIHHTKLVSWMMRQRAPAARISGATSARNSRRTRRSGRYL